jgi:N-ethylmaleimide reductase
MKPRMVHDASELFKPFTLGDLVLPNRIVMGPLTRNRATHGTDSPNDLTVLYYAQRASAGLIITEATQISRQGQGYAWTPGIYTPDQVRHWKAVTDAVHAANGRIFVQLWHVGRISHTSLQAGGAAPVAPSAILAKTKTFIETGFVDVSMPRALEVDEIPGIIADYVQAAANALKADFDGIEVHAANGYLIDQFLKDGSNQRTDRYGGSIQNRARFGLEVIDAVMTAYPKARVGIRLSPVSPANDALDSNPDKLFGYFVSELSRRRLAYIHVIEGATGGARDVSPFDYLAMRQSFGCAYIANNGYTRDMAITAVVQNSADLIAFGKNFIANPDLVERLRTNAPLANSVQATWYGGDAVGYTDYPAMSATSAPEPVS